MATDIKFVFVATGFDDGGPQRARMVGGDPPRSQLLREARSPYFVRRKKYPAPA